MFRRNQNKEQNPPKQNNPLKSLRKKVIVQAVIAVQTIIITLALVFGMSAAWYTNVLQTSGLQFEAEGWGFTGEVLVTQDPIEASPGDSGIIGLTVTNMSEDVVDVALNVSKGQMVREMQQRLFFYVDTQHTRSGEMMDRVYINSRDSYTYSVMGYNELVLTKERSNDASLKWQWVYDMLGYYFLGTVTQTDVGGQLSVNANITDYLRPVEYDLDKAVFQNGVLESVDGVSKADWIQQLSATDGYPQNLVEVPEMPGYYMVDVDNNGYGIWVYLCNWAQIQQATTYDSQLGKAAADATLNNTAKDSYIARLTVIGQMAKTESIEITTLEQLTDGLNNGAVMKLQNNLELDTPLEITGAQKAVLDLNGHTITGPSDNVLMTLKDANVTVVNGNIVGNNPNTDVFTVSGSNLTLNKVNISGQGDDAIYISDEKDILNSRVRLLGCEITMESCAVYMRGNGEKSPGRSQLIIEDCELNSNYITVMGNGTAAYWGTEIQIYNSKLTGYYAAVYIPQSDSLTRVVESTLSGNCGLVIKAGDLEVLNSSIQGIGEKQPPKQEMSGYTDTGDAIYIDCTYQKPIRVTISGEKTNITSANSEAIQVFTPLGEYAQVTVTGGEFSTDVSAFVPEGYAYSGGTVTQVQGGSGDE